MTTIEEVAAKADIFVTASGCCDIITSEHIKVMKNNAILCNIGHFDCEIDMAWLNENCEKAEIKPQVNYCAATSLYEQCSTRECIKQWCI